MASVFSKIQDIFTICMKSVRSTVNRFYQMFIARYRQKFQISRNASNLFDNAIKSASDVTQKPSERSDYIETRNLYISKHFLYELIVILFVVAAAVYFVVYPFMMKHFFTASYYIGDSRLSKYTGDVRVFYDKEKNIIAYEGHLEEGKLEGEGKEYESGGLLIYEGNFQNHRRSGYGKEYEDGELVYDGEFVSDTYEGKGELYSGGVKCYSGTFTSGYLNGDSCSVYYPNGHTRYYGAFEMGKQTGYGTEYYDDGTVHYTGDFLDGKWEGEGQSCDEKGNVIYTGEFKGGLFEGTGICNLFSGFQMESSFFGGKQGGSAVVSRNGMTFFEGYAENLIPEGNATLYDDSGNIVYTGKMHGGTIDGLSILNKKYDDVSKMFGDVPPGEETLGRGTVMLKSEIGLSVYFDSFSSAGTGKVAYELCLDKASASCKELAMLLWWFADDVDSWRSYMWDTEAITPGVVTPRYSASLYCSRALPCAIFEENKGNCCIWYEPGSGPVMLEWTAADGYAFGDFADLNTEEE